MTIQRDAKVKTYMALLMAGVPIPNDLCRDVEMGFGTRQVVRNWTQKG